MKTLKFGPIILLLLIGFSACSSARHVVIETGGGVVAMPSNRPGNREKAMELIGARCPGGFDIVREEEVPVGQVFRGETEERTDRPDKRTKTREYTIRTRYEWRLHYNCR